MTAVAPLDAVGREIRAQPSVLARRPALLAILVLGVVAALALAPSIAAPNLAGHSSVLNVAWTTEVTDALAQGRLFPRWAPSANHGLGGSAFYFYPPLAYHAAALIDLASGRVLPVPRLLAVCSTLLLWASGAAMFAWLRSRTRTLPAAIGAAVYMLAPYHLFDHYVRDALAEFAAYAWTPLLLLAVQRAAAERPRGVAMLAVCYAGLICTHLPTAVLMSLLLLPAFTLQVLARGESRGRRLAIVARGAAGAALGLALSAPVLLPAATLQAAVSSEVLWGRRYRPENWFVWAPERWPNPLAMLGLSLLTGAFAVFAVTLLLALRRDRTAVTPALRDARFWAAAALVGAAVGAGLAPFVWRLPLLAQVQFPWRLLSLVEFALVTAATLALAEARVRPARLGAALAMLLAGAGATCAVNEHGRMMRESRTRGALMLERALADRRDPDEYLPAGFSAFGPEAELAFPRLLGLKRLPLAETAAGAPLSATESATGGVRVTAPTAGERIVLKRFTFPAWQVVGPGGRAVPAEAAGPERRLAFTAPAPGVYTAEIAPLPVERIGWGLAASSALGVAASLRRGMRRRA